MPVRSISSALGAFLGFIVVPIAFYKIGRLEKKVYDLENVLP